MATRTCGKHFLAFERDSDMLEHILKLLLGNITIKGSSKENVQGLIPCPHLLVVGSNERSSPVHCH